MLIETFWVVKDPDPNGREEFKDLCEKMTMGSLATWVIEGAHAFGLALHTSEHSAEADARMRIGRRDIASAERHRALTKLRNFQESEAGLLDVEKFVANGMHD